MPIKTLSDILSDAIWEYIEKGYTGSEALEYWMTKIRWSARSKFTRPADDIAKESLNVVFNRAKGNAKKYHLQPQNFGIEKVEPKLRAVLSARIYASANLIKLNREAAIEITLRRFSGWASSQPAGGGFADFRDTKRHIGKPMQSASFEERRMLIDQGHKLIASVNQTIAEGNGAIAVEWNHVHQANYDARPEHVKRDGKIYLLRGSWAHEKGLVKPGANGYYDQITAAAEEVYCRCWVRYIYAPSRLPPDMRTDKGTQELRGLHAASQ